MKLRMAPRLVAAVARVWCIHTRSSKIRLMFRWDGHHRRSGATAPESVHLVDVLLQQGIITKVGTQPREIVGIGKADVIPMLDDHVPTHKTHLKSQNCGIFTVIG